MPIYEFKFVRVASALPGRPDDHMDDALAKELSLLSRLGWEIRAAWLYEQAMGRKYPYGYFHEFFLQREIEGSKSMGATLTEEALLKDSDGLHDASANLLSVEDMASRIKRTSTTVRKYISDPKWGLPAFKTSVFNGVGYTDAYRCEETLFEEWRRRVYEQRVAAYVKKGRNDEADRISKKLAGA